MPKQRNTSSTSRKPGHPPRLKHPSAVQLRVINVAIADLKPDPSNPRIHSERQLSQLVKSIRTFGFIQPILVDEKWRVVAGHGCLEAARRLGMREVPVIAICHLSEIQLRALNIAHNRLAEQSAWDQKLLAEQVKFLAEVEINFDFESIGFEVSEVDLFIEGLEPANNGESDPADAIPEAASQARVSREGDLWEAGKHRIYCGDSLHSNSYLSLMQDYKANAVFADPPYNVRIDGHVGGLGKVQHREFAMASGEMTESEFTDFLRMIFLLLVAYSVNGSIHFIAMDFRHLREILHASEDVYEEFKALCVWNKRQAGMGSFYRSKHELILVFKNGRAPHQNNIQLGQFGRYRSNVWDYPSPRSSDPLSADGSLKSHPTPKPTNLVADAIMDVTRRGNIVLDPFLGSGTTLVACERTGRVCRGLELDGQYVDLSIRRWQKFTGLKAIHSVSRRSFDEIEQEREKESEDQTHGN